MLCDNQVPSEATYSGDIYFLQLLTAQQQMEKGISIKIKATELFRRDNINIKNKLGSKLANFVLISNVEMVIVKLGHSSARD